MANSAFNRAKKAKRDEFYTRIEDVEQELDHYSDHFEGKTIYLNCDDPKFSAFWQYFSYNFELFGLKKLIATHYVSDGGSSYKYELEDHYDDHPIVVKSELDGDGDFRSEECIELLKEADVVATNPPFSLWREYTAQLIEYGKKFIIIGNMNAVIYTEIFPLFKNNEISFGYRPMSSQFLFEVPDGYGHERVDDNGRKLKSVSACWYTNLDHNRPHEDLALTKFYEGNEEVYPMYDNYRAIEVGRVKEIPMDYEGVMGVPITYLGKHSPDQFNIIGMTNGRKDFEDPRSWPSKRYVNPTQHNKDGSTTNGSKVNTRANILLDEAPDDAIYYTADNVDGPLKSLYGRILIVNKKLVSRKEVEGKHQMS